MKNNQVTLLSLYFFLYYGALGFIFPFITLHFHNIGMQGVQIGIITTIGGIVAIVSAPIFGSFYEKSQNKRFLFLMIQIISGIFVFLLGKVEYFWLVLCFYAIYRFGFASVNPIAENLAFNISDQANKSTRSSFGYMRLWGSLSFAITALMGGWFLDNYNIQLNFITFLSTKVLVVVFTLLINRETFNYENSSVEKDAHLGAGAIIKALRADKYLFFMVLALAITHPMGNGLTQLEPIFMSQLNISDSVIGLASTLRALGEIPFMLWTDGLINRFGITRLLFFVFILDFLRKFIVWLFPLGWIVFIMNVSICITFSLRIIIIVHLINQRVPKKYSTTALALVTMTIFGMSTMTSSILSGLIFDAFGGRQLYLVSFIGCLISLGLAYYASKFERKQLLPFG